MRWALPVIAIGCGFLCEPGPWGRFKGTTIFVGGLIVGIIVAHINGL